MMEFVVGLVATFCLVGGMVQLGLLALERSNAMISATAAAGERALADEHEPQPIDYVTDWREGDDTFRHSADDTPRGGDAGFIAEEIGAAARPDRIRRYAPDHVLATVDDPERLIEHDSLVPGSASRVGIRLLPVVRKWIYRDDTVTVRAEAWSVWTQGVY
jgi:hypothetical protein